MDIRRIRALESTLSRLDDYMQDMQKREQTVGLYMIGQLKKCHDGIGNAEIRGRLDYGFAKTLTALYNHRGNYIKAEEEYKKCIEAARYVTIEEYLGVQLLRIVSLCDASRYGYISAKQQFSVVFPKSDRFVDCFNPDHIQNLSGFVA